MSGGWSGVEGYQPDVKVGEGNPEAQKYGKLWGMEEYRRKSPGEIIAQVFLSQVKPKAGAEVIDFGCGTGRGGLMLAVLGGMKVTFMDFVRNALDPEIQEALTTQKHVMRFIKHDLEQPIPVVAEYGFCSDVMEHIPEMRVDKVLDHILGAAQHVFFSISTRDDLWGNKLIGERLHLTVHDYGWWLQKLASHGCVIHWSKAGNVVNEVTGKVLDDDPAMFYVSAWSGGQDITDAGILNTPEEQTRENVKHNISQGWTQVVPHVANDMEVMILGGGPSLTEHEDQIKQMRKDGVKLVTLNGAYNWALEKGLVPSAQIMVDARAFNKRFVEPVVDDCKYLIASQCDPVVFEGLPRERTYIWHTITETIEDLLKAQYPDGWYPIPGGSSVLLRAVPLLRMLGFKKFHLFGCDSCVMNGEHHAYAQPENDAMAIPVTVGGRVFWCHAWMASQAQEMMSLIRVLGEEIELEIYGDGLLAHILKTGADMEDLRAAGLESPHVVDTGVSGLDAMMERGAGPSLLRPTFKRLTHPPDPEFDDLYVDGTMRTWESFAPLSRRNRFRLMTQKLAETKGVEGLVAECGCYRGMSAYLICHTLKKERAEFQGEGFEIYDSFQGLSRPTKDDERWGKDVQAMDVYTGAFAAPLEDVQKTLAEFPRVTVHQGWIPEKFDPTRSDVYRFVHVDVDLYEPTLASFRYFWPRLSPGGIILCDDYGGVPGAQRAVDTFCEEQGLESQITDAGQAWLKK